MFLIVNSPFLQSKLTKVVASYLSTNYNATVEVGKVHVIFPKVLMLQNVLVTDVAKDTILNLETARLDISEINTSEKRFEFSRLWLIKPYINLHQFSDSSWNYSMYLPEKDTLDTDTSEQDFTLDLNELKIVEGTFIYNSDLHHNDTTGAIDFNHLGVHKLNIRANKAVYSEGDINAIVSELSLKEQSGFRVDTLATEFLMTQNQMQFGKTVLVTNNSHINTTLFFNYKSLANFSSFVNDVKLNAIIKNTHLQLADIGYFAPKLFSKPLEANIKGDVKGTVSDLKARNVIISGIDDTYFKGRINLIGLPDINQTFISLRVNDLQSSKKGLQNVVGMLGMQEAIIIPENIESLGIFHFDGSFDGFINDFVSFGNLTTDIGNVGLDLALKEPKKEKDHYKFSGEIKTESFDLGKFYNDNLLGYLTASIEAEGSGLTIKTVEANVKGKIYSIELNKYSYNDVEISGDLSSNLFRGKASITDENLVMDFDGTLDFRNDIPGLRFQTNISHADFKALNILKNETVSTFNGVVNVDSKGISLDDFIGEVRFENLFYCDDKTSYELPELSIDASVQGKERFIKLTSPVLDADLSGVFDYSSLLGAYTRVIAKSLPGYFTEIEPVEADLRFSFLFKNINKLLKWIDDDVKIAENTKLEGSLNTELNRLDANLISQFVNYNGKQISDININVVSENDVMSAEASAGGVRLADSLAFDNLTIISKAYLDNFQLGIDWKNSVFSNSGSIEAVGMITNKDRFDFDILPSEVNIGEDHWELSNSAHITLEPDYVRISDLNIYNKSQHFTVNGTVSKSEFDEMEVDVKDFNLDNLNPILSLADYRLRGKLSGHATLSNLYTNPIFDITSTISELGVNNYKFGEVSLNSIWQNSIKTAGIEASLRHAGNNEFQLSGLYKPFDKANPLDLTLTLNGLGLDKLNAFENDAVSNFSGHINGDIHISGDFSEPILNGELKLDSTSVKVDYLNTTYTFNNVVQIRPDFIGINYQPITDENGGKANLVGTVFHENYSNYNFDLYLEPDNFMCLNTQSGDNDMYYGRAQVTGTIDVSGYTNNLEITINAKTNKKTQFFIPLSGSGIAGEQDFVTFINKNAQDTIQNQEVNLEGIKLDINIEMTPDAEVQLIFDEQLGDIMKGRGEGNIKMEINTLGNFNMYGQYTVTEGDYMFTLQKIINKRFTVKKGGTINWYGSPYGAEIDLTAIYNTRAPLYEIMAEQLESYKNRVPVQTQMHMTGNLMSPNIEFNIDLPGLEENIKSQVKSQISSDEEMNKQVFALLVLNRFLPNNSTNNDRGTSTGSGFGNSTTSDLISNQISSWLSQISREFDVGFVYRLGDKISNEELAVALSTQIFNERLSLSGNFGVSQGNQVNQNPNSFIGDFKVEYSLTKDGRLKLKAFNESNEYDLLNTNQAANKQGVGVYYQENFDKFGEWLKTIFRGFNYKTKKTN